MHPPVVPSVLIIGTRAFQSCLIQMAQSLERVTLYRVEEEAGAYDILSSQVPDVIVLQGSLGDNWNLCQCLRRHQSPLRSFYLLLDDRPLPPNVSPQDSIGQYQQYQARAIALGADSYCWIPEMTQAEQVSAYGLESLWQTYLDYGLQRVRAYQELSQANDLLSAIALVDALTQLGNRRAFDWELPRQIEAARLHQRPLSLLLLDIDYFKRINDSHGHLVGDQVLQLVSERLRHTMRFHETPFRYGGEEFVVLLTNTTLLESIEVGERLRHVIESSPFVIHADLELSLTVSIGVATLSESDDDKGLQLLNRADQCLLEAKRSGRNQVVASGYGP